ncbi:MAG: DTW domain-containing protein [Sandaracinaceae bacterium]|nr:DTW domain-containing protein [Sandaracinaceae bacterium]
MSERAHCYVCDKVQDLCLCDRVAPVHNRTGLTIVQHRGEWRHPFGSVRIARLGLERLSVHLADRPLDELEVPGDAAVLFPDDDAPDLAELPASARPAHLVAIDGTWSQASSLRRTHPVLSRLRAVRLPPGPPSRYRIRREPSAESLSTIEAVVRALKILEPDTAGLDGLLASFDAMIDDQLERRSQFPYQPRHRLTPRIPKPMPDVLRLGSPDVALVYAELHQPRGQTRRYPLRLTAARERPGDLFDVLVESPLAAAPERVRNMELTDRDALPRLDLPSAAAALRAFLRPTDTIVAWAQFPCGVLRELGCEQPFLSAKHHFANQTGGKLGRLDDLVASFGGPPVEPWAPGRAGRQLALLDRALAAMREPGFARHEPLEAGRDTSPARPSTARP